MPYFRIIAPLLLIFFCHHTAFKNSIQYNFSGEKADLSIYLDRFSLPTGGAHITSISSKFQKNRLMEGGLASLQIKSEGKVIHNYKSSCIYAFGRCIFGDMLKATYPQLHDSYGDWTMNGTVSESLEIFRGDIPQNAEISVEIFGRGSQEINFSLSNGDKVQTHIVDGYMDNAISFCLNENCSNNSYNHESTGLNLTRIVNFFTESFLAGFLFYWIFAFLKFLSKPKTVSVLPRRLVYPLLTIIAAIHLSLSLHFAINVLASTPHISDSAIYYRQAVLLSHGLSKTAPLPSEPYKAYLSNSSEVDGDRIVYKHANRFWPALLSVPMALGIPEILNPILSLVSLLMTFYLANMFFGPGVGLISAFIFALSPYSIINSGDFMMHSASQALFLCGAASILYGMRDGKSFACFFGGIFIAYAFAIRQITVVALVPALFLLLLTLRPALKVKTILPFFLGAFLIAIFFILDNYFLTGEWFLAAHKKFHGLHVGPENLNLGANSTDANLASLAMILFGLNVPQIFLGMTTFPLINRSKIRPWLLYLFFACLAGIHLFVPVHGLHGYGPRFLYEAFFALAILCGLTIYEAYTSTGYLGKTFLSIFLCFCLYQNIYLGVEILPKYRAYNGIDPKFIDQVNVLSRPKSYLLIKGDGWQGMDQFVRLFDPTFKDRIIIREQADGSHKKILDLHPDWPVYYVDFMTVSQVRP